MKTHSVVEDRSYLHFYSVDTNQEETDVYVTRVWRGSQELDIEDHTLSGDTGNHYILSQDEIYSMLQPGDVIEDNYCHGQYNVVFE